MYSTRGKLQHRGKMQAVWGSWIRWLFSRIRSCAHERGGLLGKRYKYSERPSATTMTVTAKTNRQTSIDMVTRHGAKIVVRSSTS